MQFIFVEFWVTLEIIMYGFNHRHWHFVFVIEVKQTDYTFQFNKSCFLRGRLDNAIVALLKSVSIYKNLQQTKPNRQETSIADLHVPIKHFMAHGYGI